MGKSREVDLKGARGDRETIAAAWQVIAGTDENRYGRVIRHYREKAGMDMSELSRKLGYSVNTTAHWEAGRARPDLDTILPLCALLGIPLNEFFGLPEKKREQCPLDDTWQALSPRGRHTLQVMADALLDDEHELLMMKYRREAMLFHVSGHSFAAAVGTGAELEALDTYDEVALRRSPEAEAADIIVSVTGHSMEPTFLPGDRVFVKRQQSVRPGEIGIFLHNGEGLIKEYREDGLYSHNPDVPARRITPEDNVVCLGKVLRRVEPEEFYPDDLQPAIREALADAEKTNRR